MTVSKIAVRVAVLTGALVPVTAVLAAPFDPKVVPDDAKWVIHIDADAAQLSTMGSTVKTELLKRPQIQKGISQFQSMTGVRVPDDISGVTIYGKQFGEEHNVVIVDGKFDAGRILGLLELGPAYSSEAYGNHEIVSWDDKGKLMYGSFTSEGTAIIGRSTDAVKAAYDVLDKKTPSLKNVPTDATADGAGVLIYVGGTGLADLAKQQNASPLFSQAQAAWIVIGEKDTKAFAKGHVESSDAQVSDKLSKFAEGIRAFVSLQASGESADSKMKLLDSMLQPLTLTRVSSGIDLAWSMPVDTIVSAAKDLIAEREARMAQ